MARQMGCTLLSKVSEPEQVPGSSLRLLSTVTPEDLPEALPVSATENICAVAVAGSSMAVPQSEGLLGLTLAPSLPEGLWCWSQAPGPFTLDFVEVVWNGPVILLVFHPFQSGPCAQLQHPPGLKDALLRAAASLVAKEDPRAFFVHFLPAAFHWDDNSEVLDFSECSERAPFGSSI